MIPGSERSTGEQIGCLLQYSWVFPVAQLVKNLCAMQERDLGLIPGLGSSPGEGKGYPLQYSGLENSVDCLVHELAKSQTWLSIFHFLHFSAVSRETHTHRKRPFKTEARLGYITFSK